MNIIIVDTSTSIGFDEVKWNIIEQVNRILDDKKGHVYFVNTRIDDHLFCSRITEDDFDMKGSSTLWDSIFKIIDNFKYVYSVNLYIITDGIDTSSVNYSREDVENNLWRREIFMFWKVCWLKI